MLMHKRTSIMPKKTKKAPSEDPNGSTTTIDATKTAKIASKQEIDDNDLDSTSYSGTFRWKATKKLLGLPSLSSLKSVSSMADQPLASRIDYKHGWKGYFVSRQSLSEDTRDTSLMEQALQDLSLVDCLSFVNSILYLVWEKNILHLELIDQFKEQQILQKVAAAAGGVPLQTTASKQQQRYEKLRFFCIGCSSKAEERVLRETNCFTELVHMLHPIVEEIELWLIGPEISCSTTIVSPLSTYQYPSSSGSSSSSSVMKTHLFQGTTMDFFRAYPQYMNIIDNPSLLVGFNCGFGNFENPLPRRYDLFYAWYYDLCFLTSLSRSLNTTNAIAGAATETATAGTTASKPSEASIALPMVFFCANDYADLFGELVIMIKVFGMKLIQSPGENPFSFASTMIPPGSDGSQGEYARGNSFYYAIQGYEKERRQKLYSPPSPSQRQDERQKNIVLASVVPIFQSIQYPQAFFDSLLKCVTPGRLILKIAGDVVCPSVVSGDTPSSTVDNHVVKEIESTKPVVTGNVEKDTTIDNPTSKDEKKESNSNEVHSLTESVDTMTVAASSQSPIVVNNAVIVDTMLPPQLPQSPLTVPTSWDAICEVVESVDELLGTISISISLRNNSAHSMDLKTMCIDLHSSGTYLLLSNTVTKLNATGSVTEKVEKKVDFLANEVYKKLLDGKEKKKAQVNAKYSKKKECLQVSIVFHK